MSGHVDFRDRMDRLAAMARPFTAVSLGEVRELLRTCEQAQSIGPILDPTAFLHGADRVDRNAAFLRAVAAFVSALDGLREEAAS